MQRLGQRREFITPAEARALVPMLAHPSGIGGGGHRALLATTSSIG